MFSWFRKNRYSPPATPADNPLPRRCPLNAPGPFYTLGLCMACEAPEAEAPDLLAPLKDGN